MLVRLQLSEMALLTRRFGLETVDLCIIAYNGSRPRKGDWRPMKRWLFFLVGIILVLAFVQNYHASAPATAQSAASLSRWSSLGTYATTLPRGVTFSMPYVQETWN